MNEKEVNLDNARERIINFIEVNGPSLPIHISNHLGINTILASAFLSELLSDKEIKISAMRVGNSPLYYRRGQEFQLEKFVKHLNSKEREAYYLLNEKKVLDNNSLPPAIRVALREIKDFAVPFDYDGNIYWRSIKLSEEQAIEIIESMKNSYQRETLNSNIAKKEVSETLDAIEEPTNILINEKNEEDIKGEIDETKNSDIITQITKVFEELEEKDKLQEEKEETTSTEQSNEDNLNRIEEFFKSNFSNLYNNIDSKEVKEERLDELAKDSNEINNKNNLLKTSNKRRVKTKSNFEIKIEEKFKELGYFIKNSKLKKKEYSGIITKESKDYLCIAKDKKNITETEIMKALRMGQKRNMPVLFMSTGELTGKSLETAKYFKDVFSFIKLNE
ncbi:MAG: hypothetical protein QXJ28_02485 [Candidatus Pacearchaeota archaeon]